MWCIFIHCKHNERQRAIKAPPLKKNNKPPKHNRTLTQLFSMDRNVHWWYQSHHKISQYFYVYIQKHDCKAHSWGHIENMSMQYTPKRVPLARPSINIQHKFVANNFSSLKSFRVRKNVFWADFGAKNMHSILFYYEESLSFRITMYRIFYMLSYTCEPYKRLCSDKVHTKEIQVGGGLLWI